MNKPQPIAEEKAQIHLGHDWYVPVDERGYCVGSCYEGALGVIVQLLNTKSEDQRFALKMPRLLADTPRENHHICRLMEEERRVVYDLFAGNLPTTGLLPAQVIVRGLLENPVQIPAPAGEEERAQDGNIVLVSFEKGRRPRFVSVGLADKHTPALQMPKGLNDVTKREIELLISPGQLRELRRQSNADLEDPELKLQFRRAYHLPCAQPPERAQAVFAPVSSDTHHGVSQTYWYAYLPCVVYRWASGTYQEALTTKEGLAWDLRQQVRFFNSTLSGIKSLHMRKFISQAKAQTWGTKKCLLHGDLRPANVMHTGDPADPTNYFVIDYGSLAEDPVAPGLVGGDHDESATIPGPMVSPMRMSPFYAPERRAATERESADTAVIISSGHNYQNGLPGGSGASESKGHLVCLGWRTHLLDADGKRARPKPDLVERLAACLDDWTPEASHFERPPESNHADWPCPGDRVRIRDYIFLIRDYKRVEDQLLLYCAGPFFEVFHDRLAAQVHEEPPAAERQNGKLVWWLPISRVTELCQIKPAADIFSFGAICLYTLYYSRPPRSGHMHETNADMRRVVQVLETEAQKEEPSEARFEEMLQTLASEQCFRHVWPTLEDIREKLEHLATEHRRANREDFLKHDFRWQEEQEARRENEAQQHRSGAKEGFITPPWRPILEEVQRVAAFVTQSVPACRIILLKMGGNTAYFVLFMHFVFCCLHRKSTLKAIRESMPDRNGTPEPKLQPFCLDRLDHEENWRAVESAQQRLDILSEIIVEKTFWTEFWVEAEQIPPYEPASEHSLRVDVDRLRGEQRQIIAAVCERIDDIMAWVAQLGGPNGWMTRRSGVLDKLGEFKKSYAPERSVGSVLNGDTQIEDKPGNTPGSPESAAPTPGSAKPANPPSTASGLERKSKSPQASRS